MKKIENEFVFFGIEVNLNLDKEYREIFFFKVNNFFFWDLLNKIYRIIDFFNNLLLDNFIRSLRFIFMFFISFFLIYSFVFKLFWNLFIVDENFLLVLVFVSVIFVIFLENVIWFSVNDIMKIFDNSFIIISIFFLVLNIMFVIFMITELDEWFILISDSLVGFIFY